MRHGWFAALVVLVAFTASAEISPEIQKALPGDWQGEMAVQGHSIPLGISFALDGTVLRGTAKDRNGGSGTPLAQLSAAGRTVSFDVGDASRGFHFEGVLGDDGTSLAGKFAQTGAGGASMSGSWTLRRQAGSSAAPVSTANLLADGRRLYEAKDEEGALRAVNQCLGINPASQDCLLLRGRIRSRIKGSMKTTDSDYVNAIADFTKVITADPKNVDALAERGYAMLLLGRMQTFLGDASAATMIDRAIADDVQVVALRPDAESYYQRGRAYFLKWNLAGGGRENAGLALADYAKALTLDPKMGKVYDARASLYDRLGQTDLGDADRQKAKELGYQ